MNKTIAILKEAGFEVKAAGPGAWSVTAPCSWGLPWCRRVERTELMMLAKFVKEGK